MIMKAPRVARGQAITANLWNELADAVDESLFSPRDITAGITTEEVEEIVTSGSTSWTEISRTSDTVRVENPEDATQFVDVERMRTIVFQGGAGTLTFTYKP